MSKQICRKRFAWLKCNISVMHVGFILRHNSSGDHPSAVQVR